MPNIPYHLQRDAPIISSQAIRALRGTRTQCRPQRGPACLAVLYPKGGKRKQTRAEDIAQMCVRDRYIASAVTMQRGCKMPKDAVGE